MQNKNRRIQQYNQLLTQILIQLNQKEFFQFLVKIIKTGIIGRNVNKFHLKLDCKETICVKDSDSEIKVKQTIKSLITILDLIK